jgi:HK97 family phage portal protein
MWPFSRREQRNLPTIENPGVPLSASNIMAQLGWDTTSAAGINVTAEKALSVPGVWAAVNFIGNTIASLPLHVYRRTEGGRERAANDPLTRLLHDSPNPEWTSFRWRKYILIQALIRGRSYTYIERAANGKISALWPMDPSRVEVFKEGMRTVYRFQQTDNTYVTYESSQVIDLVFMLECDQVSHVDPVGRLRDALGLAIVLQDYANRFFQNGGVPPLSLEGPFQSAGAIQRAMDDISAAIRRASTSKQNVLAMPDGHKLNSLGYNPEQGQLLDARRFQLEEIARVYNLPPVFLQDLTHGTYSNTEQQDLNFVKHTLTHWVTQIEQEMNLKLFREANSSRYAEFEMDGLLRGDFRTRMEGYAKGIQNAIYTPNEVRQRENLVDMEGGENIHLQQNMMTLNAIGETNDDGD